MHIYTHKHTQQTHINLKALKSIYSYSIFLHFSHFQTNFMNHFSFCRVYFYPILHGLIENTHHHPVLRIIHAIEHTWEIFYVSRFSYGAASSFSFNQTFIPCNQISGLCNISCVVCVFVAPVFFFFNIYEGYMHLLFIRVSVCILLVWFVVNCKISEKCKIKKRETTTELSALRIMKWFKLRGLSLTVVVSILSNKRCIILQFQF